MDLKQIKTDRANGVLISQCTWDALLDRAIEQEAQLLHAVMMSVLEPWPCASAVHTIGAIGAVVDRDTPFDDRNKVVDWDMFGKPITQGDVDRMSCADSVATGKPDGEGA